MPHPTKPALRQAMLAKRGQVSTVEASNAASAINATIPSLIPPNALVAGYMPIRGELDTRPLLESLQARHIQLSLPKVLPTGEMVFLPWSVNDPLEVDKHGIPSPKHSRFTRPDIMLVPLLAFDTERFRLGYGGGYYDRAITALRPKTIGIGYHFQKVDKLVHEAHDAPLDIMVTEQGIA